MRLQQEIRRIPEEWEVFVSQKDGKRHRIRAFRREAFVLSRRLDELVLVGRFTETGGFCDSVNSK